jgi:hypothetical protein
MKNPLNPVYGPRGQAAGIRKVELAAGTRNVAFAAGTRNVAFAAGTRNVAFAAEVWERSSMREFV